MSEKYNRSIETLFADKQYCIDELNRIRSDWGFKSTFTPKHIDAMRRTLTMMLLYCPNDLADTVRQHLDELTRREVLTMFAPVA